MNGVEIKVNCNSDCIQKTVGSKPLFILENAPEIFGIIEYPGNTIMRIPSQVGYSIR